jgi:photosystem II stability/assembly factor-like uncharacterized protein
MPRTILVSFALSLFLASGPSWAGLDYWSPIGPDGGEILALAADPQQNGVVYAGTAGGVFKSMDGGATWSRSSRGLKGATVLALAVAPTSRSTLYAGTYRGVSVSRDGGATWTGTALKDPNVLSLAVDPRDARRIWAGTSNGLYGSRDAGAHWSYVVSNLIARALDVALDPVHPDTLYAAVAGLEGPSVEGIVRSTDGGTTWKLLSHGLEAAYPWQDHVRVAVDPQNPNVVYASFYESPAPGTRPDVTYRSTDGGDHWTATEGGYPLAVDRNGVVYAGDRRSTDHGATWQQAAAPPDLASRYAAGAAADGTLWASTERSGVFRSRDRAATWQAASGGLHATAVTSIAIDPQTPRVIYAGAGRAGVRKTLNTGQRWQSVDAGLPADALYFYPDHLLALDPRQPRTVYLAWSSSEHGLARSDDGGAHWTLLRGPDNNSADGFFHLDQLVTDPTAAGVVYFAGSGAAQYPCEWARSDDYGATRQCIQPPAADLPATFFARLVPDSTQPGALWLLDRRDRLWKSADRGTSWTKVRPQGLAHAGEPRALLLDPAHPGRSYLGTERWLLDDRPERIWRSDDGGRSWRVWGSGMPGESRITGLLMDPRDPAIFYAAVEQHPDPAHPEDDRSGVYWSRDGGRTFTALRDGLPGRVLELLLDPKNPRKLYAATEENGVYTLTRP